MVENKFYKGSETSEEEWMTREAKQDDKIFENEVDSILGFIY